MDLDDFSLSSDEDEQSTKDNSRIVEKSEPDTEGYHFPICSDKNKKIDPRLHKQDETGHRSIATKAARRTIQSETKKGQESICAIGEGSSSNISPIADNESSHEDTQSVISFNSTGATWGSSLSICSEYDLLDDLEETRGRHESEKVSDIAYQNLRSSPTAVEYMSSLPSTTSFTGIDSANESQTTHCAFIVMDELSSLQESSNSLRPPVMHTSLDEVVIPSYTKETLARNFETDEFPMEKSFSCTFSSNKFSDIDKISTNKNVTTVIPESQKTSSSITRENETSEISDLDVTGDFYDYDCDLQNYKQEDKSVRRKIKAEPPAMSKSVSPTKFSASKASKLSSKMGRSLLNMSKLMEDTSYSCDDWENYETFGGNGIMKYMAPKTWMNVARSLSCETEDAINTPRLDTESLLKEVRHFFQHNRVEADETLSWRERKRHILASSYFSDEFARLHGLLSFEELVKESLEDLKCTSSYLENQLRMKKACETLMQYSISEQTLLELFDLVLENRKCSSEISNQESSIGDSYSGLLIWMAEDLGFDIIIELYRKLKMEGASFHSIVYGSEKSPDKERFYNRDLARIPHNSSYTLDKFLTTHENISFPDSLLLHPTLFQNEWVNMESTSSTGGITPQNDESATESYQTQFREPSETASVVSEWHPNILDFPEEPWDEMIPLSEMLRTTQLESSNEQHSWKDESNVSSEVLTSKEDSKILFKE